MKCMQTVRQKSLYKTRPMNNMMKTSLINASVIPKLRCSNTRFHTFCGSFQVSIKASYALSVGVVLHRHGLWWMENEAVLDYTVVQVAIYGHMAGIDAQYPWCNRQVNYGTINSYHYTYCNFFFLHSTDSAMRCISNRVILWFQKDHLSCWNHLLD